LTQGESLGRGGARCYPRCASGVVSIGGPTTWRCGFADTLRRGSSTTAPSFPGSAPATTTPNSRRRYPGGLRQRGAAPVTVAALRWWINLIRDLTPKHSLSVGLHFPGLLLGGLGTGGVGGGGDLPLLAAEARKRQATSTGGANPQLSANLREADNGKASDKAGQMMGVSGRTCRTPYGKFATS